jgi:hypothetical protein
MTLSKRIRNLTEKHVVTSKAAKKPFLWVGLAVVSILAIAAIWNWVGELGLIKELRAEKRQGIVEVEQELEASKVKAKELELEVTRLEEELEWTKSEAEKKSPQRLTPPAQNAPENATPSAETKPLDEPSQPVAESVQEQTEPSQPVKTGPSESKPSLVSYPPEITLTKETMIPLTVNGKVSGSAKIAPGKEFKVVGVDGSDVLVAMAGSTVRIPKENSNFDEALDAANALAEEKAQAPKSAAPAPAAAKPPQTPSAPPVQQQAQQGDVQDASSESPAVQIEKIIKAVAPLKVLDSLKDFRKPGKESARTAFMRTEARKWEQAAETAKNCLRSQQMDQATTRI